MTSIAIMNAKGGVGKSTLTMSIAKTLAETCLIIDADGQMSISLMMASGSILSERCEANRTLAGLFVADALDEVPTEWPH